MVPHTVCSKPVQLGVRQSCGHEAVVSPGSHVPLGVPLRQVEPVLTMHGPVGGIHVQVWLAIHVAMSVMIEHVCAPPTGAQVLALQILLQQSAAAAQVSPAALHTLLDVHVCAPAGPLQRYPVQHAGSEGEQAIPPSVHVASVL
jgi:hypothetical protein